MYRNCFAFHPKYNLEAFISLPHVDHIHCKGGVSWEKVYMTSFGPPSFLHNLTS